jgi:hypothetical protein
MKYIYSSQPLMGRFVHTVHISSLILLPFPLSPHLPHILSTFAIYLPFPFLLLLIFSLPLLFPSTPSSPPPSTEVATFLLGHWAG